MRGERVHRGSDAGDESGQEAFGIGHPIGKLDRREFDGGVRLSHGWDHGVIEIDVVLGRQPLPFGSLKMPHHVIG